MGFFFQYRNRLFVVYSLFAVSITVIISLIFYFYTVPIIQSNSNQVLIQNAEKVSTQLETILSYMDSASLQVVSNQDIQAIMMASNEHDGDQNYFDHNYNKSLINILSSINSPLINNRRIILSDFQLNYFTIGSASINAQAFYQNYEKYTFLSKLSRDAQQMILVPPHEDYWTLRDPKEIVFSIVRIIPNINSTNGVIGYVEIERPFSEIEKSCTDTLEESLQVTIIDDLNHVIYPYGTNLKAAEYEMQENGTTIQKQNPLTQEDEYRYSRYLSEYGWKVIVSQSSKDYNASILLLQTLLISFIVLFSAISIIMLYFMTKHLTSPINKLRRSVDSLSAESPSITVKTDRFNNEIVMLTDAFNRAISKLHDSMEQTIIANKNQVQAHILAMQSQMNPHFLFNILMGMSGIAEENNDTQVVDICDKLAMMLRYISSFKDSSVPLSEEIEYTQHYLELMKVRYEEFLEYDIQVDSRCKSVSVPKLILQPIVENCFSHGFQNRTPPYRVKIFISFTQQRVSIQVVDNGEGFPSDMLEEFRKKIEAYKKEFDANKYLHSSELGGLGLTNIYLRLQLKYGTQAEMTIENNLNGGGNVSILIPLLETGGEPSCIE